MTSKQSRREWLAGLKEGDKVVVRIPPTTCEGTVWYNDRRRINVAYLFSILMLVFRRSDGYRLGRRLKSTPRIEPVGGGGR